MKIKIFTKRLIAVTLGVILNTAAIGNEEAEYDLVHKTNIYEIRFYPERLVVESVYNSDSSTFRKLFKYISGDNNSSEKIEMTIPVNQIKKNSNDFMQFILPSRFNKKTIPIPLNPDVKISNIDEGYFAVIEYSGRPSDKNFIEYGQILKDILLKDKVLIKGSAIKATYNGLFTLPLLRRNEAMFNVKWER